MATARKFKWFLPPAACFYLFSSLSLEISPCHRAMDNLFTEPFATTALESDSENLREEVHMLHCSKWVTWGTYMIFNTE